MTVLVGLGFAALILIAPGAAFVVMIHFWFKALDEPDQRQRSGY